jgi:hypothetical protein
MRVRSGRPWRDRGKFGTNGPLACHQVKIGLKAEEKTLAQANIACDAQIRVGSDRAFSQYNLIDAPRRNAMLGDTDMKSVRNPSISIYVIFRINFRLPLS